MLWWCLLVCAPLAWSGCSDMGLYDGRAGLPPRPAAYQDEEILFAEGLLKNHEVRGALDVYDRLGVSAPPGVRGTAAAGRAITSLMLLPEDQAVRRALVDHLGATRTGYDIERLVWADGGLLYWFARGTAWEDRGQFVGVRSLVEDQLPWERRRLDSADAFVSGLDSTLSELIEALLPITQTLTQIEDDLDRALTDPLFERFYVPWETFHDPRLSLVLGRAELSLLRALISFSRGALQLIAAYDHALRLSELVYTPAAWESEAAYYDHVSASLLRQLAEGARLTEARRAFSQSAESLAFALERGREPEAAGTTLRWLNGSRQVSEQLLALVRAVGSSLERPTQLPHTRPSATLNLSALFANGRLLDPQLHLFARDEDDRWRLSEDAVEAMTGDLLSPRDASLDLSGDGLDGYWREVFGPLQTDLSEVYSRLLR
jgi:hypothetical protein